MNGAIFKDNRLKLGLSQAKLATILGISKRQIINIEQSDKDVKAIYGEKISELLHQKDNRYSNQIIPSNIKEVLDKAWKEMDPHQPKKKQEISSSMLKIPYYKDIRSSAGFGALNGNIGTPDEIM